jgi:hypothetical protein
VDRLVVDREAGVLRGNAIHEDNAWDKATTDAVHYEVESLADWLGLDLELIRR